MKVYFHLNLRIMYVLLIISMSFIYSFSLYSSFLLNSNQIGENNSGTISINTHLFLNPQLVIIDDFENSNISVPINSQGEFTIPSTFIESQGTYRVFINDSESNRFPHQGFFYVYFNENNLEFGSQINNLISNDSLDSQFARPNNSSFDSDFILFHVSEILKQSYNYYYSNSSQSLLFIENLINASWSLDGGCSETNFNCNSRNYQPIHDFYYASEIQGEVISALWKSYALTQIEILREYAINFSNSPIHSGSSDCNFQTFNFECLDSKGQRAMINGYIDAYLVSGNISYLNRAENFGSITIFDSNIEMITPLMRLYELTLNSSYLNRAISSFEINMNICEISCNLETHNLVVESSVILYKHFPKFTSNWYNFKRWGLNAHINENTINNCIDIFNSNPSICVNSFKQVNLLESFLNLRNSFFYSEVLIYNVDSNFITEDELNISFRKNSLISNITLFIKDSQDLISPFNQILLNSFQNNIILNDTTITTPSTFYEFYFEADGQRFPQNSNYIASNNVEFIQLEELTESLVLANPLFFCNPFGSSPNFGCRLEYMQGDYISALSFYNNVIENNILVVDAVIGLTSNIIDTNLEDSTCDPILGDFNCESTNPSFIANPLAKSSVYRATSLISGYIDSFILSDNYTHLEYALTFANNPSWEECNFIISDFSCDEGGTFKAIEAYSKLFSLTGVEIYRDYVIELVAYSSIFDNSSQKYLSWLYSYNLLNQTNKDEILFYLGNSTQNCIDFNCSIEEFYTFSSLVWKGYQFYQDSFIFDLGNSLLNSRPISPQNYCDPNAPSSFEDRIRCQFPNEQALMISSHTYALQNYVNLKAPELNITITIDNSSSLHLNSLVDVTCSIENIGDDVFEDSSVVFLTEQTLVNGNISNPLLFLDINSSIEFDYTLNLTSGGRNQFRCGVSNFLGILDYNVTNIGEILDFEIMNLYVSQINNTFVMNLSNYFDFPLENIIINFSNSNISLNNLSQNAQYGSNSSQIIVPFINANSQEFIDLDLDFNLDMEQFSDVYISSEFGGFNNFNFSILTLDNNLSTTYSFEDPIKLFEEFSINITIDNDKLIDIENLTIYLNTTYTNISQISNSLNLSNSNIDLTINDGINMSLLESQIETQIDLIILENITQLEIFFFSSTGLNFSQIIPFQTQVDIFNFNFTNTQGLLQDPTRVGFELTNPTPFYFYNITIESLFDNLSLNLSDLQPPFNSFFFNESVNITLVNSTQNFTHLEFNEMNNIPAQSLILEVNNSNEFSIIELLYDFENFSELLYFNFDVNSFNNTSIQFIVNNELDITSQILACQSQYCPVDLSSFLGNQTNFSLTIELQYLSNLSPSIEFNSINALSLYEIRDFLGSGINDSSILVDVIEPFSTLSFEKTFAILQNINQVPVFVNYSVQNLSIQGQSEFIFNRIIPSPSTGGGGGGGGGSLGSGIVSEIISDENELEEDGSHLNNISHQNTSKSLIESFSYDKISVLNMFLLNNLANINGTDESLDINLLSLQSNMNNQLDTFNDTEIFNFLNSKSIIQLDEQYILRLIETCISITRNIFQNDLNENELIVEVSLNNICDFKIKEIYILENLLLEEFISTLSLEPSQTLLYEHIFDMNFIRVLSLDANSEVTYSYSIEKDILRASLDTFNSTSTINDIILQEFSSISMITFDTNHLDFINKTYEDRFSMLQNILLLFTSLFSSIILKALIILLIIIFITTSLTYITNLLIIKRDQIYIFLFKAYLERKKRNYESNNMSLSNTESNSIIRSLNIKLIRVEQLIAKSQLEEASKEFESLVGLYNKEYHFLNLNRNQLHQASFIFNKMQYLQNFFNTNSTPKLKTTENVNTKSKTQKSDPNLISSSNSDKKDSDKNESNEKSVSSQSNDDEEENHIEVDIFLQLNKIKLLNSQLRLDEAENLISKTKRRVDQVSDSKKYEKVYLLEKIEELEKETQHLLNSSLSYKFSKSFRSIKENLEEKFSRNK